MARFFVYGTLTDRSQVETLLDRFALGPEATLQGLHRIEGRYPTLAPGGNVEGRVLETPEIDRLDAYECVESGLYIRVSVPVADGDSAECYVGDPDLLEADTEWPGAGPFEQRVRSYLDGHEVELSHRE
jgi:gamma-glutamylaminecyclotransferase